MDFKKMNYFELDENNWQSSDENTASGYQEEHMEEDFVEETEEEPTINHSSIPVLKLPQITPIQTQQKKHVRNPFAVTKGNGETKDQDDFKTNKASIVNHGNNIASGNDTNNSPEKCNQKKSNQKDSLVDIVKEQDIFLNQDKVPYVSITKGLKTRDVEIASSHYEEHLILEYFKNNGTVPTDVKDAVKLSRAMAIAYQKVIPVYTRFNFDGHKLVLDLCDESSRIVVADKNGWNVVHKGIHKFYQPNYIMPLPIPDKNGDILDFLDFLEFDNPYDKVLVTVWIVAVLKSEIDRPILLISGEPGSGKSSVAEIIRSAIDPVDLTGLGIPADEKDFAVTLHRQQIPSFDNLSFISGKIQDLMCRVVTGGSIERRKLYTDNETFYVKFKRAMILTAIENPITQHDLLDRTLTITRRRYDDTENRSKVDYLERFKEKHASILGGILNTFVGALNVLDTLELDKLPRLADYYKFGMAVAEYIGEDKGFGKEMFSKAMKYAMRKNYKIDVDEDVLTFVLQSYLKHHHDQSNQNQCSFTVSKLFEELKKYASEIGIDPNELPGAASSLSRKLKGVVQALEHMGWSMKFSENARVARIVTFTVRTGL